MRRRLHPYASAQRQRRPPPDEPVRLQLIEHKAEERVTPPRRRANRWSRLTWYDVGVALLLIASAVACALCLLKAG